VNNGRDDDWETDEEDVMHAVKLCKKELRRAINQFIKIDNPFALVRNLEDGQKDVGGLKPITPG
jgi:hypothetical protein